MFQFEDYNLIMVNVPHSVNNARKAGTARILEFALLRARSPARLPTNSGDFRASYLASGFGVTRLLVTLYPLPPARSLSHHEKRDFARFVVHFRFSGSSMKSVNQVKGSK